MSKNKDLKYRAVRPHCNFNNHLFHNFIMKQVLPLIQAQFDRMCATGKLFQSSVSGNEIIDAYLKGFGEDPIFRDPQSSVHNCNMCKNFLHRYGNIVAVDENLDIMTLFDVEVDDEYRESFRLMSGLLHNAPIAGVFVESFEMLSTKLCYERPISPSQKVYKLGIEKNVKMSMV